MFTVRPATPHDAPVIALSHVEGWRDGYRGLLPQGHLDAIDESARAELWREILGRGAARVVLVEQEAVVQGFAAITGNPEESSAEGMVTAFYVRTHAWGSGAAQVLMRGAERALVAGGFGRARLSVLSGNPRARRFYEKAGWSTDGQELAHTAQQPGMPSPVEICVVEYTKALTDEDERARVAAPGE